MTGGLVVIRILLAASYQLLCLVKRNSAAAMDLLLALAGCQLVHLGLCAEVGRWGRRCGKDEVFGVV